MDGNYPEHLIKTGGSSSVSLFLGLFLLILAFFIMLVSISTIEDTKSKQVMDSLSSAFAELMQPTTEPTQFVSKHGDVLEPDAFQAEMTEVFTTAVSVEKVSIVTPGRDMRVDLLARELFETPSLDLRVARLPMIDRVVASLNRNPPGVRFQIVIMAAVKDPSAGVVDGVARTALERVGAITRLLIERGAPPETVSGGIYAGDPGALRFDFKIRLEDELIADYDRAVRLEYQAPAVVPDVGSEPAAEGRQ
ncbi:MAG: flagellar motor protein MotB [Rhodospirillales bacterium]